MIYLIRAVHRLVRTGEGNQISGIIECRIQCVAVGRAEKLDTELELHARGIVEASAPE